MGNKFLVHVDVLARGKDAAALMLAGFVVLGVYAAPAEEIVVGWREAAAVSNESVVTRLTVGDGGAVYKIGEAAWTLPLANVDRQAPYTINVVTGRLDIAAGDATTPTTAPSCLGEAAFWVDATTGRGLQTAVDAGGVTRVTRWCDCRESDPANRTHYSAFPLHFATGYANEDASAPCVSNIIGNACVYFGGIGSGQYMAFRTADDKSKTFTDVMHLFLVYGSLDTWGEVLGKATNTGLSGFRWNECSGTTFSMIPGSMASYFELNTRGDQHGYLYTARMAQNGQVIDAYSTPPTRGFELFSATLNENAQQYDNFFKMRAGKAVGGDFLSEAILFTNRLTAAEVVQVERYLMAKWTLSDTITAARQLSRDIGRVVVGLGASVSVAPAKGVTTGPLAFSGSGKVEKTGEGTLVLGPSGDKPPFAGEFALKAGKVAVRGGSIPALAVKGGDVLDARYTCSDNNPTAAQQYEDGNDITQTTDGEAGVVRKTGNAEARVSSVAADVQRLAVEGGSLVLSAKTTAADPFGSGDIKSVNVTIPNAGFEAYFVDHPESSYVEAPSGYGWTGQFFRFYTTANTYWSTYMPVSSYAPEGKAAMVLKSSNAYAYTTVTIDQPGTYEFGCVSTIRAGGAGEAYPLGIYFGSTWQTAERVGTILNNKNVWPRTYCRFTVATPGTYTLGFKAIEPTYVDHAYALDDLTLHLVTETTPSSYAVPNGDFEDVVAGTTVRGYPSTNLCLTGWTFDVRDSEQFNGATNSAVSAVGLYQQILANKNTFVSAAADKTSGSMHLLFLGAGGKATTATFTPPAGTYRLTAKLAQWNTIAFGSFEEIEQNVYSGTPTLNVKLVRADGTIDLGTLTERGHQMSTRVWPTTFTLDGSESVSLVIEQKTKMATLLVDDLVFVAADEVDPGELVANGSVEKPFASDNFMGDGNLRQRAAWGDNALYFGYNVYAGSYRLQIGGTASVYQNITFPAEGLYRLRFAAHTRPHVRTMYGLNPIVAYLQTADGSSLVTNIVKVCPFGVNYCEYSALFNVAAAGTYRLVIGGGITGDHRSYVDGISIRKVLGTTAACPDVPEDLVMTVAEGARLQLDYPGTLQMRTLRYNGVSCSGTVNATTHPEFISGAGSIEIPPKGVLLIVR